MKKYKAIAVPVTFTDGDKPKISHCPRPDDSKIGFSLPEWCRRREIVQPLDGVP